MLVADDVIERVDMGSGQGEAAGLRCAHQAVAIGEQKRAVRKNWEDGSDWDRLPFRHSSQQRWLERHAFVAMK